MTDSLDINIRSMRYPKTNENINLIENLRFKISSGAFVSFLGPSGAGKTTLLRIISGLENRYNGEIILENKRVEKPSRDIQIVFQNNRLLPWKTVYQNIQFAFNDQDVSSQQELIDKWLKKVGLTNKMDSWPKELSGGEESRVAFARTFVVPPKVLLLDEPFRNVDMVVRNQLQYELLRTLQENPMTVILVSHSIEDAVILSDEVHVFTASPLSIFKTFSIPIEHPRKADDQELVQITANITSEILNSM